MQTELLGVSLSSVPPVCLPLCLSSLGGLAAQEALKAISGRFTPVHQFMYFDALDLLTPRKRQSFLNKENKQGRTDPSRSRLSTEAGDYSLPPTTARLSAGMRRTRRRRRGEKEKKSFLQLPRWYSQEKLLGPEVQKRLNALNVFLVGAGAVGCEILKNFALMGVSSCRRSSLPTRRRRVGEGEKKEERKKKETGEGEQERENFFSSFLPTPCTENEVEESRHGGDLTLADADIVERSNLNRQFLFSQGDVNRYKADAAASSIRRINPCMRVHPVRAFVKRESEDQFDFPFWKRQSLVVMALDTIAARMYLDSQCLLYQKPLIEAGTLGLRGKTERRKKFFYLHRGDSLVVTLLAHSRPQRKCFYTSMYPCACLYTCHVFVSFRLLRMRTHACRFAEQRENLQLVGRKMLRAAALYGGRECRAPSLHHLCGT